MAEWTEHYFECEVSNELITVPVCTCPPGWPKKHSPALDHVDPWADVDDIVTRLALASSTPRARVKEGLMELILAREEKVRASTIKFYNRRYRQNR